MSRTNYIHENNTFICSFCNTAIPPIISGGKNRNHCPKCLHSLHVDILPGDRRAACKGLMEPISIWVQKNGEWSVIHKCKKCGKLKTNRIAADDNELLLFSLAASFISQLPFPAFNIMKDMQDLCIFGVTHE